MDPLIPGNRYLTPLKAGKERTVLLPSLVFHAGMMRIYWRYNRMAVKGLYDGEMWARSSLEVLRLLEKVGVRFQLDNLKIPFSLKSPCVYIANHMSTLETFVLPCLLQPAGNTTFVVKESLTRFPVFGPVMRSRDPVTVGRKDAREDLKTVMEEGKNRLDRGTSIIVFPQTTRSLTFEPERFNSIGVKLARRAGVPIAPIALKTDAWGKGAIIKDFGTIRPGIPVHICFGEPLIVSGAGREEHEQVMSFIQGKLEGWRIEKGKE